MNLFIKKYSAIAMPLFALSCSNPENLSDVEAVPETDSWYSPKLSTTPVGSPASLSKSEVESLYLDIRGVGDSAWVYSSPSPRRPNAAPGNYQGGYGNALRNFGTANTASLYNGHLNFINLESVVGEYCDNIRGSVDFYFLTHPDNVKQAADYGFNLFGLANNHSQDCNNGRAFKASSSKKHGPLMTEEAMQSVSQGRKLL